MNRLKIRYGFSAHRASWIKSGKKWGIMLSAEKVAKAGIRGMFKNKAVVIPGFTTKLMTLFSVLTPSWLIYWARVKWRRLF